MSKWPRPDGSWRLTGSFDHNQRQDCLQIHECLLFLVFNLYGAFSAASEMRRFKNASRGDAGILREQAKQEMFFPVHRMKKFA